MKLVLHNYWRSSASYRVRIALGLKQLDWDYVVVNIVAGDEQKSAEYRAKNPMAQVPTLEIVEDDGTARLLTQSLPIIEYLDERWPEPPLLPREPYQRARARSLAELVNSGIQPLQNLSVMRKVAAHALEVRGKQRIGEKPKPLPAMFFLPQALPGKLPKELEE